MTSPPALTRRRPALGLQLLAGLDQGGHHLLVVLDDPKPRGLEDDRLRVLIDGDDVLRPRAAGHVLAPPGDADGKVEGGPHYLARKADLLRGRPPARGPRRA